MSLAFLGALANGYNAYLQGQDLADQRKRRQEDQAYQDEQRAFQRTQNQRALEQQGREDQFRQDVQDAGAPVTTKQQPPGPPQQMEDGTMQPPATVTVSREPMQDEQYRRIAKAYQKKGDVDNAAKFNDAADKVAFIRSARMFDALEASSQGKTPLEIAQSAAKIYSSDPFSGGVKNVQQNPDGSITVDIENRDTKTVTPKTFSNSQELMDSLRAYFSPEGYEKIRAAKLASQLKREEENNKVHVVPAGATAIRNDGRELLSNDNGYVQDGTNPDGTPRMVRSSTARAAAKAGGSAFDRMDEADKLQLQAIQKQLASIEEETNKNVAGGMLKPDSPEYKFLQGRAATLQLQQQNLLGKYAKGAGSSDPLNIRQPSQGQAGAPRRAASEAQMAAQVAQPMGMTESAARRELAQSQADLEKVTDPTGRADLQAHIADIQANLAGGRYTPDGATKPGQAIPAQPSQTPNPVTDKVQWAPGERAKFEADPTSTAVRGPDGLMRSVPSQQQAQQQAPTVSAAGVKPQQPITSEQAAQFYREKRAQTAAATEKFNQDPRVPELLKQRDKLIKAGKTAKANEVLDQISAIKTSYGL